MDKKSKILLIMLITIFIVFLGITFYRTIIQNDFELVNIPNEDNISQ